MIKSYYHIDKTGLIDSNLMENKGAKYMITGSKSFNSFPYGFMNVESKRLIPSIINKDIHTKICDFFNSKNLKNIESITSELSLKANLTNDTYIQRVLREIIFEVERMKGFHYKPSRLSCIYLIDNTNDIELWREYLKTSLDNSKTYLFEPVDPKKFIFGTYEIVETIHRTDAKWLELSLNNIENVRDNAYKYWSGIQTDKPLIEVLYYGILKKSEEK